ncbi:hypothetical protein PV437_42310, partial [Streptomyces scabiei]|nr:hypothetical protein [Streptomyces scabiei]MDX2801847.1 hypothetical protein [Streptomyces scabiei]MDX2858052.1 hypothetical protein [Streptomyces scabiei]MDX3830121.1 hypothetical protein [Streptomyces scabiei]
MGVYISRHRTDATPKRASESDAEFFERIAGPFWDQVRDVINEWWSHLPPDAQPGLRSRLRDRNSDANVFSALWELYVHEMLLGSGCTVEIEQQIGTGGKYPDFLRFPRDAEEVDSGSDGTHERTCDHGCTPEILAR